MDVDVEALHRVRLMIVDNQPILRRGVLAVLSTCDDIEVVAEASSGAPAVAVEARPFPNVVLVDPGMDGVATIHALHAAHPTARLIVFTGIQDEALLEQTVRAGAFGSLLKEVSPDTLAQAIRSAHRGEWEAGAWKREDAREDAREGAWNSGPARRSEFERLPHLTPCEREALALLVEGRSDSYIADRLAIALASAQAYGRNLRLKGGAMNPIELAIFAWKRWLVPVRVRRLRPSAHRHWEQRKRGAPRDGRLAAGSERRQIASLCLQVEHAPITVCQSWEQGSSRRMQACQHHRAPSLVCMTS